MLFSAIINEDQKEQQKVRPHQMVQRCKPSQSGCWRDKVTLLASQCSAGNTLQVPETHTADLELGMDRMRNPVTDV